MSLDWQDKVFAALNTIPDATACFVYPAEWPNGTVITYSGLNDVPGVIADDREYTSDITVKVDIWDFDPNIVKEVVKKVNKAMSEIDFYRTYCFNLFETSSRLHHTTLRYIRSH